MPTAPLPLPSPPEAMYSAAQLAKLWNVSRQHIYHQMDRGDLPSVLIGSARRVKASDAADFINRHQSGGAQ